MAMKKIFYMYVVEERLDAFDEIPSCPVACVTSARAAEEFANKRYTEDNGRQHRITKFHSANWNAGESYLDFYNKVWPGLKTSPNASNALMEEWLQNEAERAPKEPTELLADWDYFVRREP